MRRDFKVLTLLLAVFVSCEAAELADPDICKNGITSSDGDYQTCSCPHGYKGHLIIKDEQNEFHCTQKVKPCEGKPCRNSGKCIEQDDGTFTCKCLQNYDGILCEKKVRPCDSQPCKNGGNCTDDGVKCFKCECQKGFKGSDCSQKITPCEISPCQNGGICLNKEDGGFKCICSNGYAGSICEKKDALYSSFILEGKLEYLNKLVEWLEDETNWRLCYRASQNGWRTSDFHSRCDYKGPTVTIIRVGYYIFGGYSNIAWGGTNGYKQTSKSFLFSLRNKDGLEPFKAPVYRNSQNAIYTNSNYGPTFGGGHDLYIKDNSHVSSGSYTNFGHTYKPPSGYEYNTAKAKNLLAGNYNFLPTEIEVFYLA